MSIGYLCVCVYVYELTKFSISNIIMFIFTLIIIIKETLLRVFSYGLFYHTYISADIATNTELLVLSFHKYLTESWM